MTLAENQNGHQLLEFRPSAQPIPPAAESHIQLPLALVVAQHQGNVLFIFNNWRKVWELPGGMIDEGETPEAAARRELQEETSQIAADLQFVGLAKFRLKPDHRLEFGAIYACNLEQIQPFQKNEEASRIMWWDLTSPVVEPVTEIDRKLAEMTLHIIEGRS